MFEGSRRIALIMGGLATVITVIALFTYDPYISADYSISTPDGPFIPLERDCPLDAKVSYFTTRTSSGREISITLCIEAMSFGKNGDRLIPYKIDEKGQIWGGAPYSMEVSKYVDGLQERFKIPPADEKELDKKSSNLYRNNLFSGLGWLVVGLAIYAMVIWVIGWIVRGFLGIPNGMDSRPE